MSDIKLFEIKNGVDTEFQSNSAKIEKSLQRQIEKNLDIYGCICFRQMHSII